MDFSSIKHEVAELYQRLAQASAQDRLAELCKLLHAQVSHYNWFGFYIARTDAALLDLGPYVGEPTDHVLIPFGKGICGQAAESLKTFVVDDVSAASNYLACSLKVKSEIVVPVLDGQGDFLGEIDIDSHKVSAFDETDQTFLEELARIVAKDVGSLRKSASN